jgi:hypothetical protein
MRVRVGPMPSAGVGLWIAYARTVVGRALVRPQELGISLSGESVEAFETYLDEWEQAASGGPTFEWQADVDPDRMLELGTAWLRVAEALAVSAERRGYPMSPPEGEEFYRALVNAFLESLEREGGEYAELSTELRQTWPGLKPEEL